MHAVLKTTTIPLRGSSLFSCRGRGRGRKHMGRIAIKVADLPQPRARSERFTEEELARLVQEVKQRKGTIYGTNKNPPQPHEVKESWEEIAEIISSLSGIKRSALKCRKRYNDVKRRGYQKMAALRKRRREMRKGPTTRNMSSQEDLSDSSNTENTEDVEVFVYQAPLEEDPDEEKSPQQQVPDKKEEATEKQKETTENQLPSPKRGAMALLSEATTRPRSRNSTAQQEEHPFLELQQNGFNMLERELSGFKQSISCLDTRLNQIEVLLRPIGHIADSLARIATAVERLTCPPD